MGIKYLGASGSKKWWLPAMDGSARSAPTQKRPLPPDGAELVELLWQNGGVVAHSQAHHQRPFVRGWSGGGGNTGASGVTGEEPPPAAAWVPDGGALGGDMYSQLWHSIAQGDGRVGRGTAAPARPPASTGAAGSSRTGGEVRSSFCGSKLVTAAPALHLDVDDDIDDATLPPPGSNALLKRSRDEFDSRSEVVFLILCGGNGLSLHQFSSIGEEKGNLQDADFEAVDETRPSRRPASKRRTRAAEVHNLSERRRRDRINEKMRALQELVPHCNKTDKASVLDEAIEYLKSLQLQVQMWMSTGMAPMMLPGAHQLMSPMTMGLNSASTIVPDVANHVQNDRIAEPRIPFLLPTDALAATPQAVVPSLFGYGSQMAHQNEIQELLAGTAAPALGAKPPSSSDGTGT